MFDKMIGSICKACSSGDEKCRSSMGVCPFKEDGADGECNTLQYSAQQLCELFDYYVRIGVFSR